jgi:DNA repair exonuclease SbcCD ATPase subunit
LQAHLLRKETECGLLITRLASAREDLQAFLAERDQRQQEAQNRLAQILTKRKVAEDDLAAKIQELERANAALAQAGDAQMTLARTLAETAKAQSELTEQERQLHLHAEENLEAEAKLAELRRQTAALEGIEAQVSARQDELRELEDRVNELEARSRLLGPAASLEVGTIHVLASDLIGELDLLDARIVDFRRFACDHNFAAELERVRQSVLDILKRHGVLREEAPEAGMLAGYRHQAPDGTETILRISGRS